MIEYFGLIEAANDLRVRAGRPKKAIPLYLQAIKMEGPRNSYCYQMIAVCYKMLRNNQAAYTWCRLAEFNAELNPDQNEQFAPASLYRDLGDVLSRKGDYEGASELLAKSLMLTHASGSKAEYGITLGYYGRHLLRQGYDKQALNCFQEAHLLLRSGDNREYELYNKLDLISLLRNQGCGQEADARAREAYLLTRDHGSWRHKLRLMLLRSGGEAIDSWIRP